MSRLRSATLLAATLLTAVGCAAPAPGTTLGSVPLAASAPAPTAARAAVAPAPAAVPTVTRREVVLSPSAAARVTIVEADGSAQTAELASEEATALLSDLGGRVVDPQEVDAERVAAELAALDVSAEPLRLSVAYAAATRTTATGAEIVVATSGAGIATVWPGEPIFLTPRYLPVIFPGTAAPIPAFTPRLIDTSKLPTNAFAELDRLGRLREAKDTWLKWLFGKKFLAIDAATAKARLATDQTIWLGPDGSRWHRDKTFKAITEAGTIDAMLPQLRDDALGDQARAVRLANIRDRGTVLPAFNRTYDVYRFLLLDLIADDYSYGGQPIRRGMYAAANFLEVAGVRTAIATWWEDHPRATAGELRLATNRVLVEKFQEIGRRADAIAADPEWYTEGQMIPGLRDPRPKTAEDQSAYNTDVAFNRAILMQLSRTMPAVLGSALFP